MGKTIAFDTSNRALSVAIFDDTTMLAQREANIARNHSAQLLPFIDELTRSVGWQPSDLTRVVVSQGPGSYTGLRIGVTTAKTLAFTLGLELVGVSSLALLATNVEARDTLIVPMMDARNKNIYAGAYQWQDGHLQALRADTHTNLKALIQHLQETTQPIVFAGEYAAFADDLKLAFPEAVFADDLKLAFPEAVFVHDPLPHAAHLPELVEETEVLTNMDDIHRFVPDYHRLSQAEADWAKANPDVGDQIYVEKL